MSITLVSFQSEKNGPKTACLTADTNQSRMSFLCHGTTIIILKHLVGNLPS